MLLLLWSMNVAAWRQTQQLRANQSGGSGAHAAVETVLDRMGFSREACLICRSGRSQEARQLYSDDHGYGLCGACGTGQRANLRMAQNGGMASPADQQAAQRLFQTIQRRLGPNPSETEGAFLMSILASFDSPEWNSLYGPVK